MKRQTRTVWDIREGESLVFAGAGIAVSLVHKSGRVARVHVDAPEDVAIARKPKPAPRRVENVA